jgi:hypothetical protein
VTLAYGRSHGSAHGVLDAGSGKRTTKDDRWGRGGAWAACATHSHYSPLKLVFRLRRASDAKGLATVTTPSTAFTAAPAARPESERVTVPGLSPRSKPGSGTTTGPHTSAHTAPRVTPGVRASQMKTERQLGTEPSAVPGTAVAPEGDDAIAGDPSGEVAVEDTTLAPRDRITVTGLSTTVDAPPGTPPTSAPRDMADTVTAGKGTGAGEPEASTTELGAAAAAGRGAGAGAGAVAVAAAAEGTSAPTGVPMEVARPQEAPPAGDTADSSADRCRTQTHAHHQPTASGHTQPGAAKANAPQSTQGQELCMKAQ